MNTQSINDTIFIIHSLCNKWTEFKDKADYDSIQYNLKEVLISFAEYRYDIESTEAKYKLERADRFDVLRPEHPTDKATNEALDNYYRDTIIKIKDGTAEVNRMDMKLDALKRYARFIEKSY